MDILLYLSELLQQRTSVGITGLGTFFKKKFAGRYDKEKQSFLPPGYSLQFNSDVKNADLLSNFIAEKRNISVESANYYITQFAEETNKKLELEHEAYLENIGRLYFTEHEGLSFDPSKNINYGSEFYGLAAVAETEVTSEIHTKELAFEKASNLQESVEEEPLKSSHLLDEEKPVDKVFPIIENVELDEVKDDLKYTLSNSEQETAEILDAEHEELVEQEELLIPVPDAVKEQHEELPNHFDHTAESEEENIIVGQHAIEPETTDTKDKVEVPTPVTASHSEYPNRFSLRSETEESKTYINLEDEAKSEAPIIKAPDFIKEQHAENPNRFGHDPLSDEVLEEEAPQGMSTWLKVTIIILILIIIAAITYLIKPELFTGQKEAIKDTKVVIDSQKVPIDTTKTKQDSIAKTDSILKANQVLNKIDSPKIKVAAAPKTAIQTPKTINTTYEVIGASFRTTKAAEKFIQQMKGYGITAKIVPIEGPFKKVSLASYKTEKEALDARPTLSKKVRIKELDIKQINTP
ncbi:SPOR domain-containing protein [Pedobacter mendelii]|uniref:SPOR domain-containing protein n=1 Tax=Pedobacter mendelii TaxID=1908240 RepID=A0ABQ2BI79_9SPHI|nr:SPOR domain-containing protein [Pedobacter mendelii]GGI25120.1 hypothetical protein GCM10008119_16080 [Pedobacter mendelii]